MVMGMPPDSPSTAGADGTVAPRRLAVLARLAGRLMQGREAAEVILAALESLNELVAYDYALLELIPGFGQGGAPTVFRATPEAIEAISPLSILVPDRAVLFLLAAGGRELGRLRVVPEGEALAAEETAALQALAGYMGLALKLAELETKTKRLLEMEAAHRRVSPTKPEIVGTRRVRVGSLRAELSQILSAQLGLAVLCERVLERLVSVMDVEAGAIFTYDERGNELVRAAQRGVPGPLPARLMIGAAAPTAMGRATAAGVPQLVRDMFTAGLESDEDRVLRTWGFHTLLCQPLLAGKRVTGGLQLMSRRTGSLSDEALALMDGLSDELALALQNAITFDRLSTMAVTDSLTGLHNHRFCEEFVRKHLMAAQRSKRNCGFLLVDIDHFKIFNDRFGHQAGDAVLRGVAAALLASIRAADLAGRYGGEEFMVALPGADLPTAQVVAERIRQNILEIPAGSGGVDERVSASIGVSDYPECATDLTGLFASADVALYAAKAAGRNRVVLAPKLEEPVRPPST